MSIDVFAAAQMRNYSKNYTDRSWLAVEVGGLIERAAGVIARVEVPS